MYEFISKGLCEEVSLPVYGHQDRGVSPGGAMDLLSLETGNLLLGNPAEKPALEIIIAPELRFLEECYVVLTGAGYDSIRLLSDNVEQPVTHAEVFRAPAGSILQFGNKTHGFRSYLCCIAVKSAKVDLQGRKRGHYDELGSWSVSGSIVRVMKGPEYRYLDFPTYFVDHPWKISNDVSKMGMRLNCLREMPAVSLENMISGPVSDGTVQFTPKGPIILLRHRQTVGGYPRIFNVINADIDKLGQFAPGNIIRFRQVTFETARLISKQKADVLKKLRKRFV